MELKDLIDSKSDGVMYVVQCHDLHNAYLPFAAVVTCSAYQSTSIQPLPTATEELPVERANPTGSDPCEPVLESLRSPQTVISLAPEADSSKFSEAVKTDSSLEELRGLADRPLAGNDRVCLK